MNKQGKLKLSYENSNNFNVRNKFILSIKKFKFNKKIKKTYKTTSLFLFYFWFVNE